MKKHIDLIIVSILCLDAIVEFSCGFFGVMVPGFITWFLWILFAIIYKITGIYPGETMNATGKSIMGFTLCLLFMLLLFGIEALLLARKKYAHRKA